MAINNVAIKSLINNFMDSLSIDFTMGWVMGTMDSAAGLSIYGWADRNFIPPTDDTSVRLSLLPTKKTWLGYGTTAQQANGLIMFECWGPVGSESTVDDYASQIETFLLSLRQIGDLLLTDVCAQEGRYIDGMYRVNVRASWFMQMISPGI